jgi:hypothetical protein
MLNHFRTYLLNKPREFMVDSVFSGLTVAPAFKRVKPEQFTQPVWEALFGQRPDATLLDYRFFQFLCLIGSCGLKPHITRFDSRETYLWEDFTYTISTLFTPVISPAVPATLSIITVEPTEDQRIYCGDQIRVRMNVDYPPTAERPTITFVTLDGTLPANIERNVAADAWVLQSRDIGFRITDYGNWFVDYRQQPNRSIMDVVNRSLELSPAIYQQLFAFISDDTPEYSDGFYHITDVINKFCMLLFGLACATEKLGKLQQTL